MRGFLEVAVPEGANPLWVGYLEMTESSVRSRQPIPADWRSTRRQSEWEE